MVRTSTLAVVGGLIMASLVVFLMIPRGICGSDGAYVLITGGDVQNGTPVQNLTSEDIGNLTILRQLLDTWVTHREDQNATWTNTTMHYEVSPDEARQIRDFFERQGRHGTDTIYRYEGVVFRAWAGQVVC